MLPCRFVEPAVGFSFFPGPQKKKAPLGASLYGGE